MSASSKKEPIRPIEFMLIGALFTLFYFFGLALVVKLFPSFALDPNIYINLFIHHGIVPLLLAITAVIILKHFKILDKITKNKIFFIVVAAFVFIFAPIWPVLTHLFLPVCHIDCPEPAEITPTIYYVHQLVAPFWHNTGATVPFSLAPYVWIPLFATLLWLYGPIRYWMNKTGMNFIVYN